MTGSVTDWHTDPVTDLGTYAGARDRELEARRKSTRGRAPSAPALSRNRKIERGPKSAYPENGPANVARMT